MVKPIVYGAIGGGVAVAIAAIVLFTFHPSAQYALTVEPRTEMVMGVGDVVRVYVQNTGSSPLTNVKIDYGTTADTMPVMTPGEKEMFSPPTGTKMITVTNDQGVTVMKSITGSPMQ